MAVQLDKIFLGITQTDQRKYLTRLLTFLQPNYDKIIIPACGEFTIIKCALEAGFKPEQIYASDISLYSSLLGFIFSGQSVDDLEFRLNLDYQDEYKALGSDIEKAAFIMWLMKLKQLRPHVTYEKMYYDEFIENRDVYLEQLTDQIAKMDEQYHGINYSLKDMRAEMEDEHDGRTIIVQNPPVFSKGYEKMFDFTGVIDFNPEVPEFDWKKEYMNYYHQSLEKPELYIWYRSTNLEGIAPENVLFGKQIKGSKFDYWLINHPDVVKDFDKKGMLLYKNVKDHGNMHWPIIPHDHEIKPDSVIYFKQVDADTALYYRDLFAHKLGNTKAESYYLMFVDGFVFATTGMMTGQMFKMMTNRVFENYGFNAPLDKYPRANRLLMLAITCEEFADVIRRSTARFNRTYELKGLRTTCLAKYRKVKLNNGILNVEHREKMPNGLYKIMYDTDFHKGGFSDVLKRFLTEEAEYAKSKEAKE